MFQCTVISLSKLITPFKVRITPSLITEYKTHPRTTPVQNLLGHTNYLVVGSPLPSVVQTGLSMREMEGKTESHSISAKICELCNSPSSMALVYYRHRHYTTPLSHKHKEREKRQARRERETPTRARPTRAPARRHPASSNQKCSQIRVLKDG